MTLKYRISDLYSDDVIEGTLETGESKLALPSGNHRIRKITASASEVILFAMSVGVGDQRLWAGFVGPMGSSFEWDLGFHVEGEIWVSATKPPAPAEPKPPLVESIHSLRSRALTALVESVKAAKVPIGGTHISAMYDAYDAGRKHAEERIRKLEKLVEARNEAASGDEAEFLGALLVEIEEGWCCAEYATGSGEHSQDDCDGSEVEHDPDNEIPF